MKLQNHHVVIYAIRTLIVPSENRKANGTLMKPEVGQKKDRKMGRRWGHEETTLVKHHSAFYFFFLLFHLFRFVCVMCVSRECVWCVCIRQTINKNKCTICPCRHSWDSIHSLHWCCVCTCVWRSHWRSIVPHVRRAHFLCNWSTDVCANDTNIFLRPMRPIKSRPPAPLTHTPATHIFFAQ